MSTRFQKRFGLSSIQCHDCGLSVNNLAVHRQSCPKSRRNRGLNVPVLSVAVANQLTEGQNALKSIRVTPFDIAVSKDVLFLLDVSSSMTGQKLIDAKLAIKAVIEDMNGTDRIGLITFDTKAFHKLKLRPLEQVVRQGEVEPLLARIYAEGNTALYDAIFLAVSQIKDKTRRSTLMVLTDGEDNSSTHTLEEALALLNGYPNVAVNIVHIDGSGRRNPAYESLCTGNNRRGVYTVIDETTIVTEVTTIFKKQCTLID